MKTFSNTWFGTGIQSNWARLINQGFRAKKLLEIGAFEGQSSCFMIEQFGQYNDLELHVIDSFEGGVEHEGLDFHSIEDLFDSNTSQSISNSPRRVSLVKHKGYSADKLCELIAEAHQGQFDWVYVDGSHQASDVLLDACLSFKLCKLGGIIIFDDYLWFKKLSGGKDLFRCPKMAIGAFTTTFWNKIHIIPLPSFQVYIQKISD